MSERTDTSGGFDTEENAKLNGFIKARLDKEFNVRCHRLLGCRWWHVGQGMIVDGAWVESPAIVLSTHEEWTP